MRLGKWRSSFNFVCEKQVCSLTKNILTSFFDVKTSQVTSQLGRIFSSFRRINVLPSGCVLCIMCGRCILNSINWVALLSKEFKLFPLHSSELQFANKTREMCVGLKCVAICGKWKMSTAISSTTDNTQYNILSNSKAALLTYIYRMMKIVFFSLLCQQDATVEPSSFIVFRDDDTSSANTNIDFQIIGDPARTFNHTCKRGSLTNETVFYCSEFLSDLS